MPTDLDKGYGGYSTFKPMRHGEGDEDEKTSAGTQYRKISDAAEVTGVSGYAGRGSKIWYWKSSAGRDFLGGSRWLEKKGIMPTLQTLSQTHVLIGEIGERDLNKIYSMMQGEAWDPNGEARGIISKSGSGHTSMSVGDIIMQGGKLNMVDSHGFKKLEP